MKATPESRKTELSKKDLFDAKIISYLEEARKERAMLREELRRQHEERMEKFDKFLDIFKDMRK